VHSLTLTDIHSGWTECAALVIRVQNGVAVASGQDAASIDPRDSFLGCIAAAAVRISPHFTQREV
jgi:hypothetical protein